MTNPINPGEVLGRVQAGQAPDYWRVLQANKGHFTKNLIIAIVLIVAVVAGVLYLLANPDYALTRGTGHFLTPEELSTWRTIDFVVAAVLFAAFAYWAYDSYRNMETVAYQYLVLMPEGIVQYKGGKQPEAIDFGQLKKLRAVRQRSGDYILYQENFMTGKRTSLTLDGRFGKGKDLTNMVLAGFQQYRERYPLPPQQ